MHIVEIVMLYSLPFQIISRSCFIEILFCYASRYNISHKSRCITKAMYLKD